MNSSDKSSTEADWNSMGSDPLNTADRTEDCEQAIHVGGVPDDIQEVRDAALAGARRAARWSGAASPAVSVIVPVFKVEPYLGQCIDSLVDPRQLDEIEIICVNDASPDGSGTLLDKYARRDPRMTIVEHRRNLGLGAARNTGLGLVSGKYFAFVDSDDWVEPNMLRGLRDNAIKFGSDVVLCGYSLYDEIEKCDVSVDNAEGRRETATRDRSGLHGKAEYHDLSVFLDGSFDGRAFHPSEADGFLFQVSLTAWGKLYRTEKLREILGPKLAMFSDQNMAFEDNEAFFNVFLSVEWVSLVREQLGHYRVNRPDSIIGRRDMQYADCIRASRRVKAVLEQKGLFDQYRIAFFSDQVLEQHVHWYNEIADECKGKFFGRIRKDVVAYNLTDEDVKRLPERQRNEYLSIFQGRDSAHFQELLEERGVMRVNEADRAYAFRLRRS